ncbi:tRNA (adenosine(37)-N6)-threonylcarbamoyltransferase complex dimerization subunit type 1 TsaB [Rubrobacter taiwanensis]|jgi:tRNA threonylcarbamoyladenosine biosynthesis protein TsaB|uniref:tRNA (Adenosine(37)-N6)-threonylcarbamoyltransferase complex dimerization subunit type 1 TsaB n=1 Tax=Rubrobacter taiwanensis TaxID=185139 RepID=A0A4R1BEP5_9ACTN|nr:tRNA (adenosine(37)-N6)-threonylcarbamoyltransferase complex dimerization subunit type 1 TsaB [Rubrobacter taiwanensis]TCJ15646.1 tRNA (adenosine(37)-N6)-threonylcarbamoyltransferase complex dimerization subunit type 1 TsaB [Rubrobacter taiwanensis]
MLFLALDASTPVTTVAVARDREVLAEISVAARGASEVLLPAVNAALELAGAELRELDRLVAGTGPGTFTGIRIAVATARALSLASGVPLAAGSTLAALAAPVPAEDVLAVIDARRREVFAQRFEAGRPAGEILCSKPHDLRVEGSPVIVGDGAVRYREILEPLGIIPPDDSPLHRVSAAGHVLAADLEAVPAEDLIPLYIRRPDAEVRRDRNPWST